MSASPQGPDWWQASDLRWYPPSMQPAQPVLPSPPQAPEARLVTAPTTLRTGERTSAQVLRNAVVFVALLVAIAGGIGWGFDAMLDEVDLDSVPAGTPSREASACRTELATLRTAVAAANATPEPDVWSDYLRAPEALRYWTVAGQEVVPIAALPPGCP